MKREVLFFVPSLGGGGAEKHTVRLLNSFDRSRFSVSVAVIRAGGSYEKELRDDVEVISLGAPRLALAAPALRAEIRRRGVDLVCPVMDAPNCVAIVASVRLPGTHVVPVVQNTITSLTGPHASLGRRVVRRMMPVLYPRAAAVIALSEGVASELERAVPTLNGSVHVIPNAGFDEGVEELAAEESPLDGPDTSRPAIVACGRMVEQKGFRYLLEAFARVRRQSPAELWMVGDGPLCEELADHAVALGVSDEVHFVGFRENPYAWMRGGDVFVLSSLWEGFGNVIVEAMATGTPVVATDCPHGPSEIITNGVDGLLVPPADSAALAVAIRRLLEDRELATRLGERGRERSRDYSADMVARAYEAVFDRVLEYRG